MNLIRKDDIENPFISESGEIIYEMVGRPSVIGGTINHSFVHVTIPIGKSSMAHYHKVSEETYYIISGLATLIVNSEELYLGRDDACLIMPYEVHQIINSSLTEPLEFLAVSAPAYTKDDSFFDET